MSTVRAPIFVQILLATLLPLILIFSLVLVTIAGSVYRSSAGAAREKTLLFAQQSAEQVRANFLRMSALASQAAQSLSYVNCEPEQAREIVGQIAHRALENAPSAYRIGIHFEAGKDAFGTAEPFSHVYHNDGKTITGYPLVPGMGPEAANTQPWQNISLYNGEPYHDSVSPGRFGPDKTRVYVASANYPIIRNNKVIGRVDMGMLYRNSFQFVNLWESDGNSRLLIISEVGTILYASDDKLAHRSLDSLGFTDTFRASMESSLRRNEYFMEEGHSPILGQSSLLCVYPVDLPIKENRIFLYMDTPTELVYSEARDSVRTVFFTFMGGLLLFSGSLFAVTRTIANPIKKLTSTADRIAHGQLDAARHEFSGNHEIRNEVDSLENSLRLMFKELEESQNLKIAAMKTEYEKKELEETSAAKDRFFANMSHEIRTPMNVILGMSEMLLMENLPAEQKKYATHIKVSAEGLLNIINDILDLSRLESSKLPLLPVHYDFAPFIGNICSMGRYLAESKGLEFLCKAWDATPGTLHGDSGRLRQVLLNVIGNAVKFTEKGTVALTVKDEGTMIRFIVEDTGPGIRQEDIPHLFEPFKQLDNEKSRKGEGAGLGLSICRNLLLLMEGAISVESEYGKGSRFIITIPKTPGDPDKIQRPPGLLPAAFAPGTRVLVVDDSESNRKVATEFLRKFGLTVDTASSGEECLTLLGKTKYSLIFMDHMMPGMDGIATTKRIRALGGSFAETPIIALSANAVIGSRELFLSSGMNDFLPKPVEWRKLQAILAKWMPEESMLREKHLADSAKREADSANQKADNGNDAPDVLGGIAQLPELDVRLGLARAGGNRVLYAEMLGMMGNAIPEALKKMDAAIQEGDTATLVNEAHKLKGELAGLGAEALSQKAAELERASEDLTQCGQKLDALWPDLAAFAAKLQMLLPTTNAHAQPAGHEEWGSFEDGLRELREALAGFNYEKSQEVISRLVRFDWSGDRNKHLEIIRAHIAFFNYEAALNALNSYFPKLR